MSNIFIRSTDRANDASESAGERRVEERLADVEEEVNPLRVVLAHRQGLQQFAWKLNNFVGINRNRQTGKRKLAASNKLNLNRRIILSKYSA